MGVHYEIDGRVLYVKVPEQFDHHNSQNLKEDTDRFLEQYEIIQMVFDFKRTQFMDSSGIGILLGRYKRMKSIGGEVCVQSVDERIYHMMDMAGLIGLIRELDED